MKVALLGNPNSIKRIRNMMDPEALFIEVVDYPCSYDEIVSLLEKVQTSFDAILFTGVRYFMYASRYLAPSIPWGYPKRSVSSVLCTLLKAQLAGVNISKITFDLHDMTTRQIAELLCDKVGMPVNDVSFYRYNDTPYYQAYLTSAELTDSYTSTACAYHLDNLKHRRANLCLSASVGVAENDLLRGYPVFLVPLTEDDVNIALNDLRIQYQSRNSQIKRGNIATVISLSVQMENIYKGCVQEIRQMYTTHQIEVDIVSYAQSVGAAVEKQSNTEFLLYTTQDDLYSVTDHFTSFDLAQRLQYLPDVLCVSIGIGFGPNYNAAKNNAQTSCWSARGQKYSCYYIMDEKQNQSGPFVLRQLKQKREMVEVQLERIANETSVSVAVLSALIKAQAQYSFQTITAEKLAKMCGLTTNNMNRILTKLEQKGYSEVIGTQPRTGAGRPKRLIRLKLPIL